MSFFEGIDCGGSGDCGFTCVGRAMYVHRQSQPDCKGHRTCNDEDFLPRGPVQAELRLLAARELAKNFRQYLFLTAADAAAYAKKVSQAGYYADSRSMCALAQAAQIDLRIWAYSDDFQRWTLYTFSPWKLKRKEPTMTLWLRLKDEHYLWLKPVAPIDAECERAVLLTASKHLGPLSGAGRHRLLEAIGISTTTDSSACSHVDSASARRTRGKTSTHTLGTAGSRIHGLLHGPDVVPTASSRSRRSRSRSLKNSSGALLGGNSEWLGALGIERPTNTLDSFGLVPGAVWQTNTCYICPCGWDPRWWARSERQGGTKFTIIRRHWLRCQGRLPPVLSAAQRSGKCRVVALRDRHRWLDRAVARYVARLQALRISHPMLIGTWWDLQLQAPYDVGTAGACAFICSRCGTRRSLSAALRWPCRMRPDRMSLNAFLVAMRGQQWTTAWRAQVHRQKARWRLLHPFARRRPSAHPMRVAPCGLSTSSGMSAL